MSSIIKKKLIPLTTNSCGIFSTRSNLQCSYPQPQNTVIKNETSLTTNPELGGSEEDPLPTIRHTHMPKKIDRTYNGTLYRSTTARPLAYDPLMYRDYIHQKNVPDTTEQEVARWTLKVSRITGLIKRYLLVKMRDIHRLANLFYFPTIDILIGGLIWLWREQGNPNVCTEYIFCLIFWIISNAVQYETCFNFLEEFQSRNLLNLFSTTLEHTEWLIASGILCIFEALISISICGSIAYMTFGINILTIGWLLVPLVLLFIASGWIMAIATSGLFLIFGQRATFLVWAIPYLILPLSAPFYAIAALPAWAQYISYCLPLTYIFEGIRLLAYGKPMPYSYLLISFIISCVYLALAVLFFNYMFKKSKEKGLARLEQE